MQTEAEKKVNDVLMKWNPIGIRNEDKFEYSGYVSEVLGILNLENSLCLQKLESYLTGMITYMGLDDSPHHRYMNEIKTVAKELFELRTSS